MFCLSPALVQASLLPAMSQTNHVLDFACHTMPHLVGLMKVSESASQQLCLPQFLLCTVHVILSCILAWFTQIQKAVLPNQLKRMPSLQQPAVHT